MMLREIDDRVAGLTQLSNEQLQALTPQRLHALYKSKLVHRPYWFYDVYDYQPDSLDRYVARIKAVLNTKPHVLRKKIFKGVQKDGHRQKLVTKNFTR